MWRSLIAAACVPSRLIASGVRFVVIIPLDDRISARHERR